VVQEHQINVLKRAIAIQPLDGDIAGAHNDLDNIAETGQVDERHDYCRELWVSLQTEETLATGLADSVAEENARVADVAS